MLQINTLVLIFLFFLGGNSKSGTETVENLSVKVLAEFPHDSRSFTQGLLWYSGHVLESTGRYGSSRLRRVRLNDGKILDQVSLESGFFGEGLARTANKLIQLTWREQIALVYDLGTFKELDRIEYSGEGWGLTFDGSWVVMSDGSDTLTFRDSRSFSVWRRLPVRLRGQPVALLNELEYAMGFIYANVWNSSKIMKIDPQSGRVVAVIDASGLPYKPSKYGEDVLNGIAYIPEKKSFLITGKLWPKIYEVVFE